MANIRTRIVLFSFFLTFAALMISAFSFVDATSAEPKKAYGSISSRVRSQTDLCETLGGGELHVSYSYENGKMVGASTSCKGGKHDGYNCTNTATTTDCWQVRTVEPPMIVQERPIATVAGDEVAIDDADGTLAQPGDGSVLQDPPSDPIQTSSPTHAPMPVLMPLN